MLQQQRQHSPEGDNISDIDLECRLISSGDQTWVSGRQLIVHKINLSGCKMINRIKKIICLFAYITYLF